MAVEATSSKLSSSAASAAMSADDKYAAELKKLKDRHKKAKADLKLLLAQERAAEEAEARQREDRRNYLLGQALRRDESEAAVALAARYAEQLTHPSDRNLFDLPPQPEGIPEVSGAPVDGVGENGGGVDDALSTAAEGEVPGNSDVGWKRDDSGQTERLDTTDSPSEIHQVPQSGGAAVGEAAGGVPHAVGIDRSDDTITGSAERDGVTSADPSGDADPDRDGAEDLAPLSPATLGDGGREHGGPWVQAADPTVVTQATIAEQAARPSFEPRVFLSKAELKTQIDETGAKRSKSSDGRWIATASTPEQAERLAALKLQPYEAR